MADTTSSSPPWKSRASALKARVAEEQSRLTSPSYGALHEKKQQQMPKKAAATPAAARRPSSPLPVASNSDDANPFLTVTIDRLDDRCPFLNPTVSFACRSGQTVWLRGASGSGKSYSCMHLAGLATLPGATVRAAWDPALPSRERIGFLFQKGVLIDSLNLAENVALALRAARRPYPAATIGAHLSAVGLSLSADGSKMPGELSGGMLRRAALAQVLAQQKRVVVLDEPFVGLDPPVAAEIVALLRRVAAEQRVAFVLVSHMEHLATLLEPAQTVSLERARAEDDAAATRATRLLRLPLPARAAARLYDYFAYSLPLIVCAFGATGAALSMLLADMLQRVDVVKIVATFLEKYLEGNPMLPMILQLTEKVIGANELAAKKKLFALALGYIFSIELGPLLTALLLAGRIGGSYAGEVGMMSATCQLDLLKLLGVGTAGWTFIPALAAALVAAPLLTAAGTAVGLATGALVAASPLFNLMSAQEYYDEVHGAVIAWKAGTHPLKYPPLVNAYRAVGFMLVTMATAQLVARARRRAQPRHVPGVITSAVVLSCLLILLLDWGFSQLYVHVDDGVEVLGADAATAFYDMSQEAAAEAEADDEFDEEFDDDDTFDPMAADLMRSRMKLEL